VTWHTASVVVWSALAAGAVGLGVLAAIGAAPAGHRIARPGAVVRDLLGNRWVRAAVVLGWMWLGWHFFAR
jgi:hypothetical protein